MTNSPDDTSNSSTTPFERIRQVDEDDIEFWSARDLMPILEYPRWQKFKNVLLKAQIACENSGNSPADHFIHAGKMVADINQPYAPPDTQVSGSRKDRSTELDFIHSCAGEVIMVQTAISDMITHIFKNPYDLFAPYRNVIG